MKRLMFPTLICVLLGSLGCASQTARLMGQRPAVKPEAMDRMLSMSRLSERHGKPEDAIKMYHSVLERDPKNLIAHHRLGVLAVRNGELDEALAMFTHAEDLGPPTAELLNDIGYALYLADRMPAAEQKLRAALTLNPQLANARNNLGVVIGEQGRFDEALAEFRKLGDDSQKMFPPLSGSTRPRYGLNRIAFEPLRERES